MAQVPPVFPLERPLQAIIVPSALQGLRLEDFPVPAPSAESWLHNMKLLERFREVLTPKWRSDQPAQSVVLVAPRPAWLEVLLVNLLEAILTDFRRANQGLAPLVPGVADRPGPRYAFYLPVTALALLLASRDLYMQERRMRANLSEASALLLSDLHALPTGLQPEMAAILLQREKAHLPWFATWEGPMQGPFWELVARQAEVLDFQA